MSGLTPEREAEIRRDNKAMKKLRQLDDAWLEATLHGTREEKYRACDAFAVAASAFLGTCADPDEMGEGQPESKAEFFCELNHATHTWKCARPEMQAEIDRLREEVEDARKAYQLKVGDLQQETLRCSALQKMLNAERQAVKELWERNESLRAEVEERALWNVRDSQLIRDLRAER